jgi:hypothetical protein
MKHMHSIALYIALPMALLASTIAPGAAAAASSTCGDLITACLVSATEDRDACIQTAAVSSTCERSNIYNLVAKRAQFSVVKPLSQEEGPAFLGPQIVDRRCVAQFDTAWLAALLNDSSSQDSTSSLHANLDECAKAEVPTLPKL